MENAGTPRFPISTENYIKYSVIKYDEEYIKGSLYIEIPITVQKNTSKHKSVNIHNVINKKEPCVLLAHTHTEKIHISNEDTTQTPLKEK